MEYTFRFELDRALTSRAEIYLPEEFTVQDNELYLRLQASTDEAGADIKVRAERVVRRELHRIGVLEGGFCTAQYRDSEPPLMYDTKITVATGWTHKPVERPEDAGVQREWTGLIEARLELWAEAMRERARSGSSPALVYACLDSICESANVPNREWDHNGTAAPTPIQEIRMIRNLLLHGTETPRPRVKAYLARFGIGHERSIDNMQRHRDLAFERMHAVLADVWRVLLKDVGYPSKP